MLSVKFRQSYRKFSGRRVNSVLTLLIVFVFIAGCRPDPFIDRSFVTDQPCSAPCWYGIIINKSNLEDVVNALKGLSFIDQSSIRVRDANISGAQVDTEVAFDCSHPKLTRCGVIFLRNGRVVVYVSLSVGYPLSLKDVVDKLGNPDRVIADLYHPEVGGCVLSLEYLGLGIIAESIDRRSEKNCRALERGERLSPKIRVDGFRYQSPVEPPESSCTEPGCVGWPGFVIPDARPVYKVTSLPPEITKTPDLFTAGIRSNFKIEIIAKPVILEDAIIVEGTNREYFAATYCQETCEVIIFQEEMDHAKRIVSPSFAPGRPFSNLKWESEDVITFDQWAQPHHGLHYRVNISDEVLLSVVPIRD